LLQHPCKKVPFSEPKNSKKDPISPVELGLTKLEKAAVEPPSSPVSKKIKIHKKAEHPNFPKCKGFADTFEKDYQREKIIFSSKTAEKRILEPKLYPKVRRSIFQFNAISNRKSLKNI
jgi:hypothetical protein